MDAKSTFVKRFGDLVTLFRVDPGNDAAQELALAAAAAAVEERALEVEAGVEWASIPADMGLKARMLARQVDRLRISAGAHPAELQALARALAHDLTPVRSSPSIQVEFVRLLAPPGPPGDGEPDGGPGGGTPARPVRGAGAPPNRRRGVERRHGDDRRQARQLRWSELERRRGVERRATGERRLYLVKDLRSEATRLLDALVQACRARAWDEVLHASFGLIHLAPRMPQAERRTYAIQVRRALPRSAVEALADLAERDYVSRDRAADVLGWIGLDAVEVALERLRRGEALGVRVFYYAVVAAVPGAFAQVRPMLRSHLLHEVRHGATLMARLRSPGALEELEPLLDHPDELVRTAVVHALGELHDAPVADAIRRALRHPSAHTRAAAAEAIATWRGGALALLIAAALQDETDRDAWQAMVGALGRIGSADACNALASVALTRRSILRRNGYTTGQRLAAVAALGLADTAHSHWTLERLARENEGVVSYAADRVLRAEGLRAG
ncbi:MAG TPA: HEAT repeat domain-containing protein [Gemmatimonadales bacterium]